MAPQKYEKTCVHFQAIYRHGRAIKKNNEEIMTHGDKVLMDGVSVSLRAAKKQVQKRAKTYDNLVAAGERFHKLEMAADRAAHPEDSDSNSGHDDDTSHIKFIPRAHLSIETGELAAIADADPEDAKEENDDDGDADPKDDKQPSNPPQPLPQPEEEPALPVADVETPVKDFESHKSKSETPPKFTSQTSITNYMRSSSSSSAGPPRPSAPVPPWHRAPHSPLPTTHPLPPTLHPYPLSWPNDAWNL